MAQKVLIMGESGTGKSTSLRNCDPAITAVVNPVAKPLPFRGKFEMLNFETDSAKIIQFMKEQVEKGKKIIVVDDFQYILSIPYMNRIKEAGWDKWNDFGANYFEIIDVCAELPEDVIVYYLTHTETLEDGTTTIKLIGKLLREKITIEGLFTTVLRTQVSDGKYYFLTQNSGKDTVKSPLGMFGSYAIDNDLNYVDEKIRNFYEFDGAKTDDEIAKADEQAESKEIEKPTPGSRRRRSNRTAEEKSVENESPVQEETTPGSRRRRSNRTAEEKSVENESPVQEETTPGSRRRRSNRTAEEKSVENESPVQEETTPVEEEPKTEEKSVENESPVQEETTPVEEEPKTEEKPVRRTRKKREKTSDFEVIDVDDDDLPF